MKVAYISHHGRPNYEYEWFASMPVGTVKFISSEEPPITERRRNVQSFKVDYYETGWENRFFASTARRVFYDGFEGYLDDVDVVVVLEVFSSLSREFVEYCNGIGKPVVVLVYELIAEHPIYKIPRYRGNAKFCLQHADGFVAVSNAAAEHLKKLGAPHDKIEVIYPGIDLNNFRANRKGRNNTALITVGKLEPHKGIDLTLAMYERLSHDFPDLKLTVVSGGSWQPQVEALAAKNPNVHYEQRIPNAELPKTLNKSGVFVLPARDTRKLGQRIGAEQFCFGAVEAMACGLAVVTTTCGALPEIVTDKNIVQPQNDLEGLYRETKKLLQDPKRLKELSEYNEALAKERYDLKRQAAALAAHLQAVATRFRKER